MALSPRPRAVLAAVASGGGRVVTYERLFELIWGAEPPATARAAVHNAIATLRRSANDRDLVASEVTGYRLGEGAVVDVERLRREGAQLLATAPASVDPDAIAVLMDEVRGRPFDDLADGPAVDALRAGVADVALGLEDHRAAALVVRGRLDEAISVLRAGLIARPDRQTRAGLLMLALHRNGQGREAIEVFERFRRWLAAEAGLDPSDRVKALARRILDDDPSLDDGDAIAQLTGPTESRPSVRATALVGRGEVLDAIDHVTTAERSVVVHGPGGIGKTALLQSVRSSTPRPTVSVRCADLPTTPLEPVTDLLLRLCDCGVDGVSDALAGEDVAALVRVIPAIGRFVPSHRPVPVAELTGERIDAALRGALAALGRSTGALVLLDDIHLASPMAQRQLATAIDVGALVVVAASRRVDLELVDGGGDIELVEIEGLRHVDVSHLVAELVDEPEPDRLTRIADRLVEVTGGNPMFVTSLVRHLTGRGALRASGDSWQIVGDIDVPPTVERAVADQMRSLSRSAQELVEALCAAGHPVDRGLLLEVAGMVDGDPRRVLDEAVDSGMVVLAGTTAEPSHALVEQAVAESLQGGRAVELHLRWAEALEADPSATKAQIAHHRYASREIDPAAAIGAVLAAADEASAGFVPTAAAAHLRVARSLVDDRTDDTVEIDIRLGRELREARDPDHVDVLIAAAQRARDLEDPTATGRALTELGDVGAFAGVGEIDPRVRDLAEWALAHGDDQAPRARLQAALSAWFTFSNDWERGPKLWDDACATAEALNDPEVLADVYKLVDPVTGAPDRFELREQVARRLIDLGDELADPTASYRGHLALFGVDAQMGTRESVEAHVTAMDELDVLYFHGSRRRLLTYFQAGLAHLGGDLAAADGLLARAATIPSNVSASWDLVSNASVMLPIRLEQDRMADLHDLVGALVLDQPTVGAWRAVLVTTSMAIGDRARAEAELERLVDGEFGGLARDLTWMAAVALATDAAVDLDRSDLADIGVEKLRPYADRAIWCGHAVTGPVATVLGRAAALAGDPERAADHFDVAFEVAGRLDAPIMLGHVEIERIRAGVGSGSDERLEAIGREAEAHGWVRLARRGVEARRSL